MDYSRLVESLRKEGTNRICFDCGVVGTTYASLNFGTFVCSQCAGILRGLNFKVKAFGISIFTLDEYEFLKKNGNDRTKNVWLGEFNPYRDEKPNPKKYEQVRQHIIKKYKQKLYYKESKGIHFINKSIEEDIKDPLDFVNKCRVKDIDIGPSWARKQNTDEGFDFSNNNRNDKNKVISQNINNYNNRNLNEKKNIDLLGGLLDNNNNDVVESNQSNIKNNEKVDLNNLLESLNFNNNNPNNTNNLNNNINNNQNNISQNIKNENNLGFDFSSFENNLTNKSNPNNNIIPEKKEEKIENENLGFDFGEEDNQNTNSNNTKDNKNILDLNFNSPNNNQNSLFNNTNQIDSNKKSDDNFGFNFDFSGKEEKIEKNIDFFNDNQNNNTNNAQEQNKFNFDFGQQNQKENNINDNLGFDFGSQNEETNKNNNINDGSNNNLGIDLDFNKNKVEEIKDAPKNINSLFEDPNSEKINNMKKNQEIQRNNDFQSLTIALDNQNQLDKINQGNFDFSSLTKNINQTNQSQTNNTKDQNLNFNFDNLMKENK